MSPSLLFFPIEEEFFEFQAPSEPAETLGSHNPVSREDQRQRVMMHGLPTALAAPGFPMDRATSP